MVQHLSCRSAALAAAVVCVFVAAIGVVVVSLSVLFFVHVPSAPSAKFFSSGVCPCVCYC
jgi:hypothetical protein